MYKECISCKEQKPINEFKEMKHQSNNRCIDCIKLYNKEYRIKNKEAIKAQKQHNYAKNVDKILLQKKEYYSTIKDNIKESKREYRKRNKDKISINHKLYYEANSIALKEYAKKWRSMPINKCKLATYDSCRKELISSTDDGTVTSHSLMELRDVQKSRCFHCGIHLDFTSNNSSVHLDHYVPLNKGGVHSIGNLVWSCAKCNSSKRAKLPEKPLVFTISTQ